MQRSEVNIIMLFLSSPSFSNKMIIGDYMNTDENRRELSFR
jgi:hypothetical protein